MLDFFLDRWRQWVATGDEQFDATEKHQLRSFGIAPFPDMEAPTMAPKVTMSLGGGFGSGRDQPSSAKRKRVLGEEEPDAGSGDDREAVTDFGARKKKAAPLLVIPLINENVWRAQDGTPIPLQPPPTELPTDAEPAKPAPLTTYGLVIQAKKTKEETHVKEDPDAMVVVKKEEDEAPQRTGPVTDEEAAAALMAEVLRNKDGGGGGSNSNISISAIPAPILARNAVPGLAGAESDADKYRHDVSLRPDEATLEDYEKVPVDQFGAALLRGMGWKEGQGIGRNKKNAWVFCCHLTPLLSGSLISTPSFHNSMLNPIEFIARPELLGLGAQPADLPGPPKPNRAPKPGEVFRDRNKDYAPVELEDGRKRHYREVGVDDTVRLLESKALKPRTVVVVTAGRLKGQRGTVVTSTVKGKELLYTIEIDRTRTVEKLYEDEIRVVEEEREGRRDRDGEREKGRERSRDREPERERDKERERRRDWPRDKQNGHDRELERVKSDRPPRSSTDSPAPKRTWLHPHLVVRVISKKIGYGELYKRKMEVADVTRPGYATLRGDRGELFEGKNIWHALSARKRKEADDVVILIPDISEKDLETVIPSAGDPVIVVAATTKAAAGVLGHRGTILEKNKDKEKVVVQLKPDMDVVELSFDDVCMLVKGSRAH